MDIDIGRRGQVRVAKQRLEHAQLAARVDGGARHRVPEPVQRDLRHARRRAGAPEGVAQRVGGEGLTVTGQHIGRELPLLLPEAGYACPP